MREVRGRKPRLIEAFGESKTVREWSEDARCPISRILLKLRLRNGWAAEAAIKRPKSVTLYMAFGEQKSLPEWSEDQRCVPCLRNLRRRVEMEWEFERCLTAPERKIRSTKPRKEPEPRLPHGSEECFTAFGETKSLFAWGLDQRCSVRYDQLRHRLRAGWALQDAITVPMKGGCPVLVKPLNLASANIDARAESYAAFGERKPLADWANDQRCRVSLEALRRRIASGMPLEAALTAKRMATGPGAPKTYEAFGEAKTVGEWAKDSRCVVSARTLFGRLAWGVGMEEALTRPLRGEPVGIEAFGERKRNFEWAQDSRCCVSAAVMDGRIRLGWPVEEAITTSLGQVPPSKQKPKRPERPKRIIKLYEGFGERKSLSDWLNDSRCVVASRPALLWRLKAGVPFEEALTTVPSNHLLYEAFGEKKTFGEWAKDARCRVPIHLLSSRLHRDNWPLERALTQPPLLDRERNHEGRYT